MIYNPFLQGLFIQNDSTPLPHFKTAAFYMTADSIVILCRLNVVSLGAHSLLCIPEELTHHVCTTLLKQKSLSSLQHICVFWYSLHATTCLMAAHKYVSHCSFMDTSLETESSHTAVKDSQMNTSLAVTWWQASVRSCISSALMEEDIIWQGNKTTTCADWNKMKTY